MGHQNIVFKKIPHSRRLLRVLPRRREAPLLALPQELPASLHFPRRQGVRRLQGRVRDGLGARVRGRRRVRGEKRYENKKNVGHACWLLLFFKKKILVVCPCTAVVFSCTDSWSFIELGFFFSTV